MSLVFQIICQLPLVLSIICSKIGQTPLSKGCTWNGHQGGTCHSLLFGGHLRVVARGSIACWRSGARGFCQWGQSVSRQPQPVAQQWYISPFCCCTSICCRKLPFGDDLECTGVDQADTAIRKWCVHGPDVLPVSVDSVKGQYQADNLFFIGSVCYYGGYQCN